MKKVITAIVAVVILALMAWGYAQSMQHHGHETKVNPKETIFEHLGDTYGWEVPFSHTKKIPLPIIAFAQGGKLHCFMSSRVTGGETYQDGDATFMIPHEGDYKGKLVQVLDDGTQYRPWDFSITKNALGIFIAAVLVILMAMSLRKWYKREGMKGPRGVKGMLELVIEFVYTDTIKPIMGKEAPKYGPYLLTHGILLHPHDEPAGTDSDIPWWRQPHRQPCRDNGAGACHFPDHQPHWHQALLEGHLLARCAHRTQVPRAHDAVD